MTTTYRPRFQAATGDVGCYGANHRDRARLGHCATCLAEVARTDNGRILDVTRNEWDRPRYVCWSKTGHQCDQAFAASVAAERDTQIAAGEIVPGQHVTVVKGRKVPRGTQGVVIGLGDGDYGRRVEIQAGDQPHFLPLAYVEARPR